MKWLVNELINPMAWVVIGLFFLWIFRKRIKGNKKVIGYVLVGIIFYLSTTQFIPQKLASMLENKYPTLNLKELDRNKCYNIIVLGGGLNYIPKAPANSQISPVTMMRLAEAVRLYWGIPCSKIITSGYSKEEISLGETAAKAALELGVSGLRIHFLTKAKTTGEEAKEYLSAFDRKTPLIISTSAIHMPRAIFLFSQLGVEDIRAAPTDYVRGNRRKINFPSSFIPAMTNSATLKACLHEIIGLWYARNFGP